MTVESMAPKAPRTPFLVLVAAAACVLLASAGAYHLPYEPAPLVRVRWRDGVTAQRRAELERRFLSSAPFPTRGGR